MCFEKTCESLRSCVKIGAGIGNWKRRREVCPVSRQGPPPLDCSLAIPASLTFLLPLLPLCLSLSGPSSFLFLPLSPASQLLPTPSSKQEYGSRTPSPPPDSARSPSWLSCARGQGGRSVHEVTRCVPHASLSSFPS